MPAKRKALCVGINYAGTEAELRGPVNDALRWVDVLTRGCAYGRDEVLAMIDEYPSGELVAEDDENYLQPTQENILAGLDWLVRDVREGDSVLFAFSGHGAQVSDCAAGSDERLEEAICPADWDTFEWAVPYRLITDAQLHGFFCRLPAGALLTVAIDACVGGAPLRVPLRISFEYPDRELDNAPITQGEYEDFEVDCQTWLGSAHANALPRRLPRQPLKPLWRRAEWMFKEPPPPLNEGLAAFCFAACRGSQTALDASLEGVSQGCMSFCLLQAFELLNFRCTYLQLAEAMDRVARNLRKEAVPSMDQYFQLSYGKNAGPDECLMLDPAYAFVAKDKSRRRRGQRHRAT